MTVVPARAAIATSRLALQPLGPEHGPSLWRAAEASLPDLLPWMAWATGTDAAATMAFAQASEAAWEAGSAFNFALVLEDEAVGTAGYHAHDALHAAAQLGYWLRSDLAGRGLMTEAAGAVVNFGFTELHLHRIELHASPANVASVRVAEKLGFRREGLLRHGSRGSDGWHDVWAFGLLEHEHRS